MPGGRIGQQEEAMLGVLEEISQILDAPGLGGFANPFLFLVE